MTQATKTRRCTLCGCPLRKFLRVRTVAKALNLHPRSVRNIIACGGIEAVRIGAAWRVLHDSLDAYLCDHHSLEGDEE